MKNKLFFSLILILICLKGYTQVQYPVMATVTINTPYSLHFADYYSEIQKKLTIQLQLKQSTENVQVGVRIKIKVNEKTIIESPSEIGLMPTYSLFGNMPEIIEGNSLEQFFNEQSIKDPTLLTTGKFPEGILRVEVDAFEVNRFVKVSNTGFAIAAIFLNDPPVWQLPWAVPTSYTKMIPIGEMVNFQWRAGNRISNSAFTTQYDFILCKVPDGMTPNEAISAVNPENTLTTDQTFVSINRSEWGIELGKTYVCQVRAYDELGSDMFKNNGMSNILYFTYGDDCKIPTQISSKQVSAQEQEISWTGLSCHTGYKITYREENKDGGYSDWYTDESLMNRRTIRNLNAGSTYQFQIYGVCNNFESEPSDIIEFTLKTEEQNPNRICGPNCGIPTIDPASPALDKLNKYDVIEIGGFKALVTDLTSSTSPFSGKCDVIVPTVAARIQATFENITLNQKKQVTSGEVLSVLTGNLDFSDEPILDDSNLEENPDSIINNNNNLEGVEGVDYVVINDERVPLLHDEEGKAYYMENGEKVYYTPEETSENGTDDQNGDNNSANNTNNQGINNPSNPNYTNTQIGKDIKTGESKRFGPLDILFVTEPTKLEAPDSTTMNYSSDNVTVKLKMNDPEFGKPIEYQLTTAKITYTINSSDEKLKEAKISWNGNGSFVAIGAIGGEATEAELNLDSEGKLSGNVKLKAALQNESSIANFIYIQPGMTGIIGFVYNTNPSSVYEGEMDFSNVKNISISLEKNDAFILNSADNSSDKKGEVNYKFSGNLLADYQEFATKFQMNSIDFEYLVSLKKSDFQVVSFKSNIKVSSPDGFVGDVIMDLLYDGTTIKASPTSSNTGDMFVYNFAFKKEKTSAEFSKTLVLNSFKADGFDGKFTGVYQTNDPIDATITAASASTISNKFKYLTGSGTINCTKYGLYKINTPSYDSTNQKVSFSAEKDDANSSSDNVNSVVFDRAVNVEFQTVASELVKKIGPVTVIFEQAPKSTVNSNTSAKAELKFTISDGEYEHLVKIKTNIKYRSESDKLTYLEVNEKNLTEAFDKIYAFTAEMKELYLLYDIQKFDTTTVLSIRTSCKLEKPVETARFLYISDKVNGFITFTNQKKFAKSSNIEGLLVYNELKDYNLELKIENDVILSVPLVPYVSEEQTISYKQLSKPCKPGGLFSFAADGVVVVFVDEFNLTYGFHYGKCKMAVSKGSLTVLFSELPGVEKKTDPKDSSTAAFGFKYSYEPTGTTVGVIAKDLKFKCGFKIVDFQAEVTLDATTKKIKKAVVKAKVENDKFSGPNSAAAEGIDCDDKLNKEKPVCIANMIDAEFTWENGKFTKFSIKSDIVYKKFIFQITEASFDAETGFKASGNMKYDRSLLKFTELKLSNDGVFTIKDVTGKIKQGALLINFKAKYLNDEFAGNFDAYFGSISGAAGDLVLGTKTLSSTDQFNYGFFNITYRLPKPIPIVGPICLKRLGGALGWNAKVLFENDAPKLTPSKGSWGFGGSIGFGDAAGIIEAGANPLYIQFGSDGTFGINLRGYCDLPARKPWVHAYLNLNYEYPTNNINASVGTVISMPSEDLSGAGTRLKKGALLEGNLNLGVIINKSVEEYSGKVDGTLFKESDCNFSIQGNFLYKNTLDPKTNKVLRQDRALSGNLKGGYKEKGEFLAFKSEFKFSIAAGINSTFDDVGLKTFTANHSLSIYAGIKSGDDVIASASAASTGLLRYTRDNNSLYIYGKSSATFVLLGLSYTDDIILNQTFYL